MSTGDRDDIASRLWTVLPPSWFVQGQPAPNITAAIQGFATVASWAYGLIAFAKNQTRLLTSSGMFIDLWAYDRLGLTTKRRRNEADALWSDRVKKEVIRERVTRGGLVRAITELTGKTPVAFEPWSPTDCGGWASRMSSSYANGLASWGSYASGGSGRWGSRNIPNVGLVTVYRPGIQGVANVGGWGSRATNPIALGGWSERASCAVYTVYTAPPAPPSAVTVAYFIANQSALNLIPGGFAVADTSANITANLTAITSDIANITSITTTDGYPVTVGNSIFNSCRLALEKVSGGFVISGQASSLNGNLSAIQSEAAHIITINALNGIIAVTIAQLIACPNALAKVIGGFAVVDTRANIAANYNVLTANIGNISSVTASDGGSINLTAVRLSTTNSGSFMFTSKVQDAGPVSDQDILNCVSINKPVGVAVFVKLI